ncbi:Transient Receptor Potential Cation Channel Subfamily M Member 5 [Manis pentadactyla]|nr:Transient Receptor Potential Cation Channel Subfamily M Member 5 [Manis pentadactyla]
MLEEGRTWRTENQLHYYNDLDKGYRVCKKGTPGNSRKEVRTIKETRFSKLEELILGTMYSRDVTPFKKNNFFFPTRKTIFWVQESSIFLGSEISSLVFRSMLPEPPPERQEEGGCLAVFMLPQEDRLFLGQSYHTNERNLITASVTMVMTTGPAGISEWNQIDTVGSGCFCKPVPCVKGLLDMAVEIT